MAEKWLFDITLGGQLLAESWAKGHYAQSGTFDWTLIVKSPRFGSHTCGSCKNYSQHGPPRFFVPTFRLASSSSSLRTHLASASSGLVSGDRCRPSGLWPGPGTPAPPIPWPFTEPETTWGLPPGESSELGLSVRGRRGERGKGRREAGTGIEQKSEMREKMV